MADAGATNCCDGLGYPALDSDAYSLLCAMQAGEEWAAGLRVGDRFLGCGPVADGQYISRGCRAMFRHGALDVLSRMQIITDMEGRLTEYRPIPRYQAVMA